MNPVPSVSATTVRQSVVSDLAQLDSRHADYAVQFVDRLLASAQLSQTSDIHLQPTRQGLAVSWRQDGVLHALGTFPSGSAADVVTRLKVLASLLTYRTEVPQEGRIRNHPLPDVQGTVDMRVSTFPTIHGERAVVRLFADAMQLDRIEQIGLPEAQAQKLRQLLTESTGAILITGPAGSGKTTTAYACLR
ncbi:MAG: Flp pilus assembly complex ATPase component TadA, partial [Planctomycetales bacterium]|nr:Flp pilus assembly complex ATPase component TadA [Planctomycetales bacterium]